MHNELSQILIKNGFECYLVGGAVRDYYLDEKSSDYDLATNAKPHEINDIFKGRKISNVGETFKVAIVDGIEIATFRKDVYFGGSDKNCVIKYADNIEEDLARRDLTMNSLAKCMKTNRIIDPFGGIKDIVCKQIRFVGKAEDRIKEDPNRMIRAARFYTKIGGGASFAEETISAIKENLGLFHLIAKERIRLEIMKAMKIKIASNFFIALHQLEMLQFIFPTLDLSWAHDGGPHHSEDVFTHMMVAGDYVSTRCPIMKLTAYLHDIGKVKAYNVDERSFIGHEVYGEHIARKELRNLKFSNDEVETIARYTRFHMRNTHGKDKSIRKLIRELHENGLNYRAHTRLKCADRAGNFSKKNFKFSEIKNILLTYENLFDTINKNSVFSIRDLTINGNDVIQVLNLAPGRIIGLALNFALEAIIDNKVNNSKDELLDYLKNNFVLGE